MNAATGTTVENLDDDSQRNALSIVLAGFAFFIQFRVTIPYLFFQSHPAYGTLTGAVGIVVFVAITALMLLFETPERLDVDLPKGIRSLFLFLAWSGISICWTLAASRTVATMYWLLICLEATYALIMIRYTGIDRGVKSFIYGWYYGGTAVAACALITQPRAEGGSRLGDPLLLHPNLLGNTCAVSLLCGSYVLLTSKRRSVVLVSAGIQALALILTFSKTAMLALLIAYAFLFVRLRLTWRQRTIAVASFLTVLLASYQKISEYLINYLVQQQGGEALDTFTGRTVLWAVVVGMLPERLWFGHGFLSFRDVGPQIFEGIPVVHAHNELLMLLFTAGIIGTLLGYGVYVCLFMNMRRLNKSGETVQRMTAQLGIAFLIYHLIRSITEASQFELLMPSALIVVLFIYAGHHLAKPNDRRA